MNESSASIAPCSALRSSQRSSLLSNRLIGLLLSLPFTLLLSSEPAHAQWRVDRVFDGDSLRLIDKNGQRLAVRLAGIDAPEKNQAYADRSRQNLILLMANCKPELSVQKIDRYGRSVSQLFCGERDLALAQLERGYAWHFTRYAKEQPFELRRTYREAQQRAQAAGLGLWRDDNPIEPWIYRDQQRALRHSSGSTSIRH